LTKYDNIVGKLHSYNKKTYILPQSENHSLAGETSTDR